MRSGAGRLEVWSPVQLRADPAFIAKAYQKLLRELDERAAATVVSAILG